jgi:fructoselysine transporter
MAELGRKLGLGHAVALIVGTVIGSGVFITLPIVAKVTGSPLLALAAWFVGGLIWIPQILLLAELGTAYPENGFAYLYLKKAGSPLLAFLYVWTVFWTSDTPSISIIALSASSALKVFHPPLGTTWEGKALASLLILALTYLHVRDVKLGGNVQIGLTIAKLSPLVLLIFLGLFLLDPSDLSGAADQGHALRRLVAGVAATTWSYAGFPNILYMAGEIRRPQRTLPVALIGSALGITICYTLIALATTAIVPFGELVAAEGTFANPFGYLPSFASVAAGSLAISAFISMIGAASACIMVQPRIEYAIARDGLWPRPFAAIHPRYETPFFSILAQSGVAVALVLVGGIENLLGYFTLSYLLQNALVYAAIPWLRRRRDYQPSFRSPGWATMIVLSVGTQLYLAYGAFVAYPTAGVLAAAVLIGTGLPAYAFFRRGRRAGGIDPNGTAAG